MPPTLERNQRKSCWKIRHAGEQYPVTWTQHFFFVGFFFALSRVNASVCRIYPVFQVKTLLDESCSGGKYVQKSVKLDPMNGRQRWLMHKFVGSSTSDVKLSNLPGPAQARPMEVRARFASSTSGPVWTLGIVGVDFVGFWNGGSRCEKIARFSPN